MIKTDRFVLFCNRCKAPLPNGTFNTSGLVICPACGVQMLASVFPAFFRGPETGEQGEDLLIDSEAGCFYHPAKKAVAMCDNCGRFLCALCEIELAGRRLCSSCIQTGKKKGKIKNIGKQRTLYDEIALSLAVLPVLIVIPGIYFTFITAPIALYVSIRHWNAPRGVIPRSRFRFVLAMILASAQIIGWITAIGFLIASFN